MIRRPNLKKAGLLAGLVCVVFCLSGLPGRFTILAASASRQATAGAKSQASEPASKAGAPNAPAPLKSQPPSSFSSRLCQPLDYEFLAGGFLSSLVCHYIFGYPMRSLTQRDFWPPGLLDLLALMTLCYAGYWVVRRLRRQPAAEQAPPPPTFLRLGENGPPTLRVTKEAEVGLAAIEATNPDFNLEAFREEVLGLLKEVYEAWNRQELEVLNGRLKDSLLEYLRMGLRILILREETSYLEDLTLRDMAVTAAGINDGKEFITVCFQGSLMDYVVHKRSGKLLAGSMAYPTPFKEFWDLARPRGQGPWVVQDIREM
jgi:hypothetical protein